MNSLAVCSSVYCSATVIRIQERGVQNTDSKRHDIKSTKHINIQLFL